MFRGQLIQEIPFSLLDYMMLKFMQMETHRGICLNFNILEPFFNRGHILKFWLTYLGNFNMKVILMFFIFLEYRVDLQQLFNTGIFVIGSKSIKKPLKLINHTLKVFDFMAQKNLVMSEDFNLIFFCNHIPLDLLCLFFLLTKLYFRIVKFLMQFFDLFVVLFDDQSFLWFGNLFWGYIYKNLFNIFLRVVRVIG